MLLRWYALSKSALLHRCELYLLGYTDVSMRMADEAESHYIKFAIAIPKFPRYNRPDV